MPNHDLGISDLRVRFGEWAFKVVPFSEHPGTRLCVIRGTSAAACNDLRAMMGLHADKPTIVIDDPRYQYQTVVPSAQFAKLLVKMVLAAS